MTRVEEERRRQGEDALVVEREVRLPEEVLGHGREDAARRPVPDRVEEEFGHAERVPGRGRRRSVQRIESERKTTTHFCQRLISSSHVSETPSSNAPSE